MMREVGNNSPSPGFRMSGMLYTLVGICIGTVLVYIGEEHFALTVTSSARKAVAKCDTKNNVVNADMESTDVLRGSMQSTQLSGENYSYSFGESGFQSCLDPEGPIPVAVMSLGRSGTDSTWQILRKLTGSQMKAIEITGGSEDDALVLTKALEGYPPAVEKANNWDPQPDYDWRAHGGGIRAARGFYHSIKDDCVDGKCADGRWLLMWLCEEQQRFKEAGGLVGLKWKGFIRILEREPNINALKIMAHSATSPTPIRVIRSRRNPLDVYLSDLKHRSAKDLPDHCKVGDDECFKQHASILLQVPIEEMMNWVSSTYASENAIDDLISTLGIRAIHVDYDKLYYPRTQDEGELEWNRMFKFLDQPANWTSEQIADAAGLKPTTKSRSHKVLIQNFEEVFKALNGTVLEQFLRF
eukprot:Nitzschia sp. Nitz4//scaffold8_size234185//58949//60187//NITZ4_001243-RA/size234185-processed-gene-0.148-mRNA-1//-1//CDS//3329559764//2529//frame0